MAKIDTALKGVAWAAWLFGALTSLIAAPMWAFLRLIDSQPPAFGLSDVMIVCTLGQTGVIAWLGLWLHQEVERREPVTPPGPNQIWRRTEERGPFILLLGVMIGLFGLFDGMASNDVLTFVLMEAFSIAIVMVELRVSDRQWYVAE